MPLPRTDMVDGPTNKNRNTCENLEAFGAVLASLKPDQMRSIRALIHLMAGKDKDIDEESKAGLIAVIRQILQPDCAVLNEAHYPVGTKERVDAYRRRVGEQLFRYRKIALLTQADLARRAGVPQSHISRIESGKFAPNFKTMEKIASVLGVQTTQLDPGFPDER